MFHLYRGGLVGRGLKINCSIICVCVSVSFLFMVVVIVCVCGIFSLFYCVVIICND